MYCGSNKTAIASQRQLSDAMMRLIREKPYAEITVSELCRTAGISRQTFYTLFTSRENVMTFSLQQQYCFEPRLPEDGIPSVCKRERLRAFCRGYSEYLYHNRELLRILADNRIDHLLYDSLYKTLDQCLGRETDPDIRSYAVNFYAGGISCVARQYAEEGCVADARRLEELLYILFSGEVFQ